MSSDKLPTIPNSAEPDAERSDVGALAEVAAAAVAAHPPQRVPAHQRWLSLLEVLLCSGYPTQVLLAFILLTVGITAGDERGDIRLDFVLLLSFADAALVVGLVWAFLRLRGEEPARVLLGGRRFLREALLGLSIVPMLLAIAALLALIVERYLPWLHNVPTNPFEALLESVGSAIAFAVVAIVAGGVREEVQRAFVLHRFEQHLGGAWLGLIIFSLAFGLGHLIQGYDAALLTGLFGLLWGIVYLRRLSIVAPVVSHAVFNTVEVILHAVDLA
ncbi:MAG: CPBP family intramembrane metalloprotease [Luteitalea sp.]|nr:CPBP family intramembrane metalloprotease [Luteitalea sp.]